MINAAPPLTLATYTTLLLAVIGLWCGRKVWLPMTALAIVFGYASGILTGVAAAWLVLMAGCCVLYLRFRAPGTGAHRLAKAIAAVGVLAVGILLGTHSLPGFHNFRVAHEVTLSPGATPYTLYLNFDKTMVGVLIIGVLQIPLICTARAGSSALMRATPVLLATVAVTIAGSLALGYVRVDAKWHELFWIWAPANLLMTCLSEEAFFRGFLQREIRAALAGRRYAEPLAIGIAAAAFGAAHLAGGTAYAVLATLAGAGYGYAYARTGRLEMAMLTHFALNATHFLLFTYPRAA